jgi:hypothetical protein
MSIARLRDEKTLRFISQRRYALGAGTEGEGGRGRIWTLHRPCHTVMRRQERGYAAGCPLR